MAERKRQERAARSEAENARRASVRHRATLAWRAERKVKPFNPENSSTFSVLAETHAETFARLARWSVESEAGGLKNLINRMLWRQEQDILRGAIARRWDATGKGNEAFGALLYFLKATNWPQPSALVKVARHLGVLPPQTRGIKLAPVWVMVRMEHRSAQGDEVRSERHVVNIVNIVGPAGLQDDFTTLPAEKVYGQKLGCKRKIERERGRGKKAEQVKPVLLGTRALVEGPGIIWCEKCRPLYKKPDR